MFGCDPCNRDSGDGRACLQCNAIFERQITLDEHILRTHPNSIASVTSKIHQCTRCAFKTTVSGCFKEHLSKHPETSSNKFSTCTHCDATFKRKSSLDNHLIKQHPNFISSVTNKIHKCTKCSYETTISSHLKSHLSKHSETPAICTFSKCLHCKASFRKKISLDDHILKNHPKVHECTLCGFKTTISAYFKRHMLKHPETTITCTHCKASFNKKISLDDHIIKYHPNFASSVTSKIHKCTKCNFETTMCTDLKRHSMKHAETPDKCTHCDRTFKTKSLLDNHLIKKHPNFVSSVTNKIHKCTMCSYETTISTNLRSHLLIHAKTPAICRPCNAIFKRQTTLDEHILRTHPNSISSVTSKLHECTQCAFKTTARGRLKKHLLKHSETKITCPHCKAKFRRRTLLDNHVIKKHPNFVSSVTSKIYKCTKCAFETTINTHLKRHSLKHTETRPACTHCDQTFKRKYLLDNHVLKKHPNVISSAINKIYKCTECNYETTISASLRRHMKVHSKTLPNLTCVQCNTTFKRKIFLDDHIVKKHPDFMESVTSRIHECRKCTFKTAFRNDLNRHSLNHLETAPSL
nr:unnamed protein product [Callosobruchus analis]